MTAKNMAELQAMLKKEMKKAMQVASKKIEADMYEETGGFYTGGDPVMYERTGALGDTPEVTAVKSGGNTAEFTAYLDTASQYTTGKNPTMEDVLNLADKDIRGSSVGYLAPVVGKHGFWNRIEKKIDKELNDTLKNFFS